MVSGGGNTPRHPPGFSRYDPVHGGALSGASVQSGAMASRKIRILTAKVGLDGHDRGIKVISRALRDAGVEVIYTGLHQTPEMVVETAIQEDVDGIGISLLSGAHMTLFPEVLRLLEERGAGDIVVFGGGIIPDEDIPPLREMGVSRIFGPGTSLDDVVAFVNEAFGEKAGTA
jgi:methylmalonyl-CoA mutase, C-terminal domain